MILAAGAAVAVALSVLLCVPLCLSLVHPPTNRVLTRASTLLFGEFVAGDGPRKARQVARLRAAHVAETHHTHAARTLFFSAASALVGASLGVAVGLVSVSSIETAGTLAGTVLVNGSGSIRHWVRFSLFLGLGGVFAASLGVGCYWARWYLHDATARTRSNGIDASLPRTVAFTYALSRSGTSFPTVLSTLADNDDIYGEAATEIGVAVREMETFGIDVLTALSRTARRTPSENLAEFSENLASVLGSGRNLSGFLRDQYERYEAKAESQQLRYLELLATLAEAYVSLLVVGPLLFVTILVVIGLVLSDTLSLLRVIVYLGIPLATAGYVVYVDSLTRSYRPPSTRLDPGDDEGSADRGATGTGVAADGGTAMADASAPAAGGEAADRWQADRERLQIFDRLRPIRDVLSDPYGALLDRPIRALSFGVPLALLWFVVRVDFSAVPADSVAAVMMLDGPFVEATALALGSVALVHELRKRRIRAYEAAVPDFLDRLASVNEAGLTVVESFERVAESDLGALTPEVRRLWRDIEWGADVETALARFDRRVGSGMVTRATALVANATRASGDLGPVLRIAADEAEAARRLREERRQEMLTYQLVIYISFFVFLAIVAALTLAFVPAVLEAQAAAPGAGVASGATGGLAGFSDVAVGLYTLTLYHMCVIHAVCSGVVAGQLGEGTPADGIKHVAALLALTSLAFVVL
ncbi:type II secretion system F family protein [Haloprofundus salinisoli]|uniref:type II secretion system F family protein n=1 Tax=Haloprofundus salinisoli TaxID=2876193 RepID=UPI001CCB8F5A|nr:type II secretion system F family protein [Haloprofundus salinisoli]